MVSPVRTKSYKLSLETTAAVPIAARTTRAARAPAWTTATVATSAKGTTASRSVVLGTRTRRTNRLGQDFQVRGNDYYLPYGTFAYALTAHFRLIAQRQVKNAPLAAVHGAEVEWGARFLDAFRCGLRAHTQFLNPQHAMVVGVEAQEGMLLGSHSQSFGRQLLDGQKQFRFIRQQQVHILAAETDQDVWILEVRMHGFARAHRIAQRKARAADHQIQKFPDARLGVGKGELL